MKCFTIEQVKVFLTTKVELNNCLQQYNAISVEAQNLRSKNTSLESDNQVLHKKVKRNRGLVFGFGGGWLVTLLLILLI